MYNCKDISFFEFMGMGTDKKKEPLAHLSHNTNHFIQPNNPLTHPTSNCASNLSKDITIDINHPNTIIPNHQTNPPSQVAPQQVSNPAQPYPFYHNPYYYFQPPQQTNLNPTTPNHQIPPPQYNQPPPQYNQPPPQNNYHPPPRNQPTYNDYSNEEYVEFKTKGGKTVRFKPKKNKKVNKGKPLEEIKKEFDQKIINEQANVENVPK